MRKFSIRLGNRKKISKANVNPNRAAVACINKSGSTGDHVIINLGADGILRIPRAEFNLIAEAARLHAEDRAEFIEEKLSVIGKADEAIGQAWRALKKLERALKHLSK